MIAFIDIKPGQWVLAFQQPFGPYVREMPDLLESYAVKHWMDSHRKDEIFFVAQVETVKPKTFTATEPVRYEHSRIPRCQVIAACRSKNAAIALRDKFFAIGEEAGDAIEKEMYRRIEKFTDRKRAAAEKKIRRLFPSFFIESKGSAE
jgi:hypothetical protein